MFYSLKFVWNALPPLSLCAYKMSHFAPSTKHVYHRIKTLLPIYHRRLIKKISLDFIFHFSIHPRAAWGEENERIG
jgi:hypothetical protein